MASWGGAGTGFERADGSMPRCGLLPLLLLGLAPCLAAAQPRARLDVTLSDQYRWRGITRVDAAALTANLAAGISLGRLDLTAGVLEVRQLGNAAAGTATLVGRGRRGLGQRDFWAEAAVHPGRVTIAAAATRSTFHGTDSLGGRSGGFNTWELGAFAEWRSARWTPRISLWHDVGGVRGSYLEAGLVTPVLGWPFPPYYAVSLEAAVGASLSQSARAGDPSQRFAWFRRDGLAFARLGADTHLYAVGPVTLTGGTRLYYNDDPATRGAAADPDRWGLELWLAAGLRLRPSSGDRP